MAQLKTERDAFSLTARVHTYCINIKEKSFQQATLSTLVVTSTVEIVVSLCL